MTQIKRVPFDYEYFKQHPETKLETREGDEARFIGERKLYNNQYPLLFEHKDYHYSTTIEGYYSDGDFNNIDDILMLIEAKEVIRYINVHDGFLSFIYDTLEEAIKNHDYGTKSVAKLIIVDGEIDFKKCETVHKY